MGSESEAAWRGVLDGLVARSLDTPGLLIADGAAGLGRALAALRCTAHKHRNRWRPRPTRRTATRT